MLGRDANTFRRQCLLAISLSWIGGFTNVIALLVCGVTVSHQTGNTTQFGRALAFWMTGRGSANEALVLPAWIVSMFLTGAFCSGLLTEWGERIGHARRYVAPIAIEAILLTFLVLALLAWPTPLTARPIALFTIVGLAAAAMGLQNGTITRISGSVVRTTHLTGVITDIGLELAKLLAWFVGRERSGAETRFGRLRAIVRHQSSLKRLTLLLSILVSFLFGVTIGAIAEPSLGAGSLLIPVTFLTLLVVRQMAI